MHPVNRIVVVGGGTAGWLAAAIIAAKHRSRIPAGFSVTVVESPNVPTIGVGSFVNVMPSSSRVRALLAGQRVQQTMPIFTL